MLSSRIPCFCPDGVCKQPNLRYLSISDDSRWTVWNGSDYFYPEMIPEPDYSDSGDETRSEDEERRYYTPNPRAALERLHDMTEVSVSNVSTKRTPPRKVPAGSVSKATKQAPRPAPKSASQVRKPPPKSTVAQYRSKSPMKVSTATVEPSTTPKSPKSPPQTPAGASKATGQPSSTPKGPKSPPKPPTEGSKSSTPPKREKSPERAPRPSRATPSDDAKPVLKSKPSAETDLTRKAGGDSKSKTTLVPDLEGKTSSQASDKSTDQSSDEDQLIKPRKPYAPSTEEQKLHKELKFSQKYGKLASPKTELQLALERYTENKVRKEMDAEEKGSLEKILEYQAKKIEMQETMDENPAWVERLQRPPSAWPNPKTEEFYRVHARVVSNNILTQCFLPEDDMSCCSSSTLVHSDSSGSDS